MTCLFTSPGNAGALCLHTVPLAFLLT